MRLKEIRERKGISQWQAAIALNLSPTVYNRYENGIREPSNVILVAMADYFGVAVDEILGRNVNYTEPQISEPEKQMLESVHQLTPENRVRIEAYLEGLLASQGN
jgi:transcriptional regulator with XRE-family HTH domain